MLEGTAKLGSPLNSAMTVKKLMEDAGYVDVVEVVYKWPLNRWPANKKMKEIGTQPSYHMMEVELASSIIFR